MARSIGLGKFETDTKRELAKLRINTGGKKLAEAGCFLPPARKPGSHRRNARKKCAK